MKNDAVFIKYAAKMLKCMNLAMIIHIKLQVNRDLYEKQPDFHILAQEDLEMS